MRIVLFLILSTFIYANDISYKISFYEDKQNLPLNLVKEKQFTRLDTHQINKGFNFNPFYIKLELQNDTAITQKKVFSLDNPTIDYLWFFDGDNTIASGDHQDLNNRDIDDIYFAFNVIVEAYSKKIYYLKIQTKNAFVIKFFLQDYKKYYKNTNYKKMFLYFFFGFMSSIIIYNGVLFIILKEKSYLVYVLFELSTLNLLLASSGVGSYMLWQNNPELNEFILKVFDDLAILLGLVFTKTFLNTRLNFKNLDKIINIMIFLLLYVMFTSWEYHSMIGAPVMIGSLFLILYIAIYSVYKKVPTAKIFLVAWLLLMSAAVLVLLKNFGMIETHYMSKWVMYIGAMLEAIVFSVALAKKIDTLKLTKEKALKINKVKLDAEVDKKTTQLNVALRQKEMLLKELHHRVKNNLQVISSFINLSSIDESSIESKHIYENLKQRVNAIGLLHDCFYEQNDLDNIDTKKYIQEIVHNLNLAYNVDKKDIDIFYNIKQNNLEFERLLLVSLIINELVTNSFKYAFNGIKNKIIKISFFKRAGFFYLSISDNGNGFDTTKYNNGLKIVSRLAKKQLESDMSIVSKKGKTKFCFIFREGME